MKKIVSIVLSITLFVGIFAGMDITLMAGDEAEASATYVLYQALRYSGEFEKIFGDASSSYANLYYTGMAQDGDTLTAIKSWEAMHIATEPSHTLESGWISKKDIYKLAIFDMLDATETNTKAEEIFEAVVNERNSYVYEISSQILDSSDIDISELKSFECTAEVVDSLNTAAKLAGLVNVIDVASSIASVCSNMYDAVNAYASYQAVANMKNGVEEILTSIAKDTSNPFDLRMAASECVSYFNDGYDQVLNKIICGTEVFDEFVFDTVADIALDWAWGMIISAIPGGAAVLIGAKGIRVLTNSLFELDKRNEIYFKLEADVILENAIRRMMASYNYDYTQDSNYKNAVAYMRAVDMYKRIVLQGFDYSIELLENKASAPATQWFDWLNGDYSDCIELINEIETFKENKRTLYAQYESIVSNDYINLNCPDFNKVINDFNNQELVEVESISLSQVKEIRVGDKGYIGDYIQINRTPVNANSLFMGNFTSENEEILKLNEYDFMEVIAEGECTITLDWGGKLKASITVRVGENTTSDTEHDYLKDFEYFVNEDGYITVSDYNGSASRLVIPSTFEGIKVSEIKYYAFSGCKSLTSISIPEGVVQIGSCAFENCSNLKSIIIPASIKLINVCAFEGCEALTDVYINDIESWLQIKFYENPLEYADRLYVNGALIDEVVIPTTISSIPRYAFSCKNIESVVIADSVTNIGIGAFENCSRLTSIIIPDSVTEIGKDAFKGCNFESIVVGNGVNKLDSISTTDRLKSIVIGTAVTEIPKEFFLNCVSLEEVTIGDAVNKIGYAAFEGCTNLSHISIPESVTSISGNAFKNCSTLKRVTVPDSVITLGDEAFSGCSSMEEVVLSDNLTELGEKSFYNCAAIKYLKMPCSLNTYNSGIGQNSIERIHFTVGSGVMTDWGVLHGASPTGYGPVYENTNLSEIIFDEGISHIGECLCVGCENLKSITLPASLKSVGDYAFKDCSGIETVYYNGNLKQWCEIDFNRFYANPNCYANNLYINNKKIEGHIEIPEGVTIINESVFENCQSITSVHIPNTVITIGLGAFADCFKLKEISIPNSVQKIGSWAFQSCDLHCINLGKGLTKIDDLAFYDVWSLCHIYYVGDEIQWDNIDGHENLSGKSTAKIHYNTRSDDKCAYKSTIQPTCTEKGYDVYCCTICDEECYRNYTDELGHDYVNGLCSQCQDGNSMELGFKISSTGCLQEYSGDATDIIIPRTIDDIEVKSLGGIFEGNSEITSVTIPEGVTRLDYGEFRNCINLKEIHLPQTLREIKGQGYSFNSVFENCSSLERITIPENVTELGDYLFKGCTSLGEIEVSDNIVSIGENAFYDTAFYNNEANYEEGLLYLGKHVIAVSSDFKGNCEIKDGTKFVACYVFDGMELASLSLPASIAVIEYGAFKDCTVHHVYYGGTSEQWYELDIEGENTALRTATRHYEASGTFEQTEIVKSTCANQGYTLYKCSVCSIEKKCYYESTPHQYIEIGQKEATCINPGYLENVCAECGNIKKTNVGDRLPCDGILIETIAPICTSSGYTLYYCSFCGRTYSGDYVDSLGCEHDYEVINNTEATCTQYGNTTYKCKTCGVEYRAENDELIPTTHNFLDGVCIECGVNSCFDYHIIDGEVTISDYSGNDSDIVIPENIEGYPVVYIGNYAFSSSSCVSVTIPDNVVSIGEWAFYNCSKLEKIVFSKNLKTIYEYAFYGCSKLENMCLPEGVEVICTNAFQDCDSLTSITLPRSVRALGRAVFKEADKLVNIYVSADNEEFLSIDGVLFNKDKTEIICYPMGKIGDSYDIPNGVITIGIAAFYMSQLTQITIPKSVKIIKEEAFGYCRFQEVVVPSGVTSIGDKAFYYCRYLETIILNEGLKYIGDGAFSYCYGKKVINIPTSVTSIGDNAFYECGCEEIYIPKNVAYIGDGAFANSSLLNITVDPENQKYSAIDGVLYNKDQTVLICYPEGKVSGIFEVPEGIIAIRGDAFHGGANFIILPMSLKTICDSAFWAVDSSSLHVLYAGTQEQWGNIYIGLSNAGITGATRHYSADVEHINVSKNEPTCTLNGSIIFQCSICDKSFNEIINYLGHDKEVIGVVEPTCTAQGYTKYHCNRCGADSKEEVTQKLGHDGVAIESVEPTCVESGYTMYHCDRCNKDYKGDTVYKLGHDGEIVEIIEPTCTDKGYTKYHCNRCDEDYTGNQKAVLGHADKYVKTVVPTCIEVGYDEYCCSRCSRTLQKNNVKPIGHTFDANICIKCNRNSDDCIESEHNYKSGGTWVINRPNADYITIRFSTATATANGDYIYIIDAGGNEVKCEGSQLAGKTLKVDGDSITIKLEDNNYYFSAWGFAISEVYAYVYLTNSDIAVDIPMENPDSSVELKVRDANDKVTIQLPNDQHIADANVYDIYLEKDGEIVQPEGNVTIRIPVPENMVAEDCKVFHISDSGEVEDMCAVYEDGYMVFTTDHFSYYALVEVSKRECLKHTWDSGNITKRAGYKETGTKTYTCTICQNTKVEQISAISSVMLSATEYTYTGSKKTPSVTVKDSKGKKLVSGTDYQLSYSSTSRKAVGKYYVKIIFMGKYSGSKALYFTIVPKNSSSVKATLYGYDDVKITWSKVSGASGYKVYYKKSTSRTWSSKTTTGTSMKLANLSDGVKYDIKVVTYKIVGGDKYYSTGKSTSIYTLKKITGVKAKKSGTKVKISWTNISGETGYQISRSTKKSGTKVVATYKTTSGKYKNISATRGKTYYYKVRTYKVVNGKKIYSPWSTAVKYIRK